ncbi:winged helix-turn-helix domain-containing protein [Paenibacillus dendritiformis]|uniref:winged helix-turn-helix domain-containing protein n=1 Tax=Paenibacillus dendritiformis TaxID=130049 RepID=UPI00248BA2EE|nr:winged helix-turn-helix domain-containing protein [Paenibacillus dendritiformis]WGU97621.1 winged helix-turn-helix domain-containing protein [Paenibacillus dendritiformis]
MIYETLLHPYDDSFEGADSDCNPDEKDTLKKIMLWEQSLTGMLGTAVYEEDNMNQAVKDDVELDNGNVIFDVGNHSVQKNGKAFMVSTLEFKLLYYLVEHTGHYVSDSELADYLDTSEGMFYIYIKKIREKIEENPSNPATLLHVRGKGYILHPARTEAAE